MAISEKNHKVIWGQSAAMCAMCKKHLVEEVANQALEPIGEVAHIEGENPGSKRYNTEQTNLERNAPKNLILLCPNDHTHIDRDEVTYSVQELHRIKKEHLEFITKSIKVELPNVTFAEVQVVVSYLVSNGSEYDTVASLDHVTPKEKIDKNALSIENANLITMGMTRVRQVKDYLNTNPDVNFSERLRTKLSKHYNEEKEEELDPNNIFSNMLEYLSAGSNDFKTRAAALSVLTYFFETCDIFEK